MISNASNYYQQNAGAMRPVRNSMPEIVKAFGGLHQAAMRNGAISVLEKELVALGIGLAVRCENCIYAHVQAALANGATREQILETAAVAVMMQGGPTYTYLPRVVEALDALTEKSQPEAAEETTAGRS